MTWLGEQGIVSFSIWPNISDFYTIQEALGILFCVPNSLRKF